MICSHYDNDAYLDKHKKYMRLVILFDIARKPAMEICIIEEIQFFGSILPVRFIYLKYTLDYLDRRL